MYREGCAAFYVKCGTTAYMLQPSLLDNDAVHINQRLNNINRTLVQQELARVRTGNGRAGFSESAGKLMYTDRDDRGQQRTREVLALEDRDAAFQEIIDTHVHPISSDSINWSKKNTRVPAGARRPTGTVSRPTTSCTRTFGARASCVL